MSFRLALTPSGYVLRDGAGRVTDPFPTAAVARAQLLARLLAERADAERRLAALDRRMARTRIRPGKDS